MRNVRIPHLRDAGELGCCGKILGCNSVIVLEDRCTLVYRRWMGIVVQHPVM
jgi:hypothetical protein